MLAVVLHRATAQTALPPDPLGLRAIEREVVDVIDRVLPATVAVRTRPAGQGFATGVLIDPTLVMTAGHVGLRPGESVTITLIDGRTFKGTTLGQVNDHDVDVGLIRLHTEDTTLPWLEPAPVDSLEKGEWIVMLGHAGMMRNDDLDVPQPAARVGRVLRVSGSRLEVDAPFDSGDSGGPIVDLEGRIIGIVSRSGFHSWQNFATNAQAIRTVMDDLMESRENIPVRQRRQERRFPRSIEKSKRDPSLHAALAPYVWSVSPSIVRIMEGDRVVSHGTVVGDGLVVTKASLLARHTEHPHVEAPNHNAPLAARVRAIDAHLDLALLEVDDLDAPAISWTDPTVDAGTFLIVPSGSGDVLALGAVARDHDALPLDRIDRPFMGVGFREHTDPVGLRITTVTPSAPAHHAGVHRGDVLVEADGVPITDRASIRTLLDEKRLGDPISLLFDRDGEAWSTSFALSARPAHSRLRLPTNTATGTSRFSSGFGDVILCDAPVKPHELTVPVVDLSGNAVGLVLARRSRSSTVVLGSDRVREAIEALTNQPMLDAAAAAERLAAYRTLHTVDRDGVLTLEAEEAFPRGSTLRRERRDDTRTTWGFWTEPGDALEWDAVIDAPGVYSVSMVHSCRYRNRGTPIRCSIGDAAIDSIVKSTSNGDFSVQQLGTVTIEQPGRVRVRLQPLGAPRDTVTSFARLVLKRKKATEE